MGDEPITLIIHGGATLQLRMFSKAKSLRSVRTTVKAAYHNHNFIASISALYTTRYILYCRIIKFARQSHPNLPEERILLSYSASRTHQSLTMDNNNSQSSHIIPHQLCRFCRRLAEFYSQDIFRNRESYHPGPLGQQLDPEIVGTSYTEPLAHHDSLADLEQSAAQGCHICALYGGVQSKNLRAHSSQLKPYVRLKRREDRFCGWLDLEMVARSIYEESDEKSVCTIHMFDHPHDSRHICSAPLREIDSYGTKYQWCTTTDCEEGYEMMTSWLSNCLDSHKDCQTMTHQIKPSRLLDLKATNGDGIRLVLAEEVRAKPYATLSYRWGSSANIQLTTLNLHQFRSHVVLETLPRTIRDAIKICRRLSVRYLWVDALCIIQDDGNDLALVISQMGSIYANCLFTIAASDSTDAESGCFRARMPLQREDCIVSTKAGLVMFSVHKYRYDTVQDEIECLPLSSRGWVYQERMLSPRTIHFAADEVFWDCRHEQKWYNGVENSPVLESYALKRLFLVMTKECPQNIRIPVFQFVWSNIIYGYTGRRLSDENDRLSALAGIIELSTRIFGLTMSYGLVIEDILNALLWSRESYSDVWSFHSSSSSLLGPVPSWTWLSKLVRVEYHEPSAYYDDLFQILIRSACITKAPPVTPFSSIIALTNGLTQPDSIRIRCWIQACHLVPFVRRSEPNPKLRWSLVPVTTKPNIPLGTYLADVWSSIARNDFFSNRVPWDQSLPFLQYLQSLYQRYQKLGISGYIYCQPDLQLSLCKSYPCLLIKRLHGREKYSTVYKLPIRTTVADFGLLCEPIDASKKLYRRVGYFHEMVEHTMTHEASVTTESLDVDRTNPALAYLAKFGIQLVAINDHLSTPLLTNHDKDIVQAENEKVDETLSQGNITNEGQLLGLPELLKKLTLFQHGWEEQELELI